MMPDGNTLVLTSQRGDEPITRVAVRAVLSDWHSARDFPSWPGAQVPRARAGDTTAVDPAAIDTVLLATVDEREYIIRG